MRAKGKVRLEGYAKVGRCDALARWFCGLREHLIVTRRGLIAHIKQTPGNRHDVNGLYALLEDSFRGLLLGDTGYWPRRKYRRLLARKGIEVAAATCKAWHFQNPPEIAELINSLRRPVERFIGLYDQQFHADRTRSRSLRHYMARRWTKALAHNASRYINSTHGWPFESTQHFRLAS